MFKITIPGRPIPYVRMTQKGKYVKENAQRYLSYKDKVGYHTIAKFKGPISSENMAIGVRVYLYGKSTPMGMDGDIDNYIKTAMDSLNGIVYEDDRQVIKAYGEKQPCESENEQRMEIEIERVS